MAVAVGFSRMPASGAGLNATLRKCLGYRTPAEVFKANLLGRSYRREKLSRQPKSQLG